MITDQQLTQFLLSLTRRQYQVLELTSDGLTNKEIAERLVVQPSVIAEHLTDIYGRLGGEEAFAGSHPKRSTLLRAFGGYFDRHPDMRRRS